MIVEPKFKKLESAVNRTDWIKVTGRVSEVVGLVIESNGPNARVGDLCLIHTERDGIVRAEVVGFKGDRTLLMPLGELNGVRAGNVVEATGHCLRVPVGPELLGRTLNGLGEPIDGLGALQCSERYPVWATPPNPLGDVVIGRSGEEDVLV